MLERYIVDTLNAKFGQYIKNLHDKDKIHVSAWNGEVSFSDLLLDPDAITSKLFLQHETAPIKILYGKIGCLEVKIPWRSLHRKYLWRKTSTLQTTNPPVNTEKNEKNPEDENGLSCFINISDVYILISNPTSQMSTTFEKMVAKEREIQTRLASLLRENAQSNDNKDKKPRYRQLWRQFGTSIFSNLMVSIQNIHFRYEDNGLRETGGLHSFNPKGFAMGITLDNFCVKNADFNSSGSDAKANSSKFVGEDEIDKDDGNEMSYKIIDVEKLSIYWNSNSTEHLMSHVWERHDHMQKEKEKTRSQTTSNRRDKRKRLKTKPDGRESSSHQTSTLDGSISKKIVSVVDNAVKKASAFSSKEDYYESSFNKLMVPRSSKESIVRLESDKQNYILQPISASVNVCFSNQPSNHISNRSSSLDIEEQKSVPPVRAHASIPSCNFSFSRSIIEDATYLRKAVRQMNLPKDDLEEEKLKMLSDIRPTKRPDKVPRLWWKYSYLATCTLLKQSSDRRCCRDWLGLVKLLRWRRQYIVLYRNYLDTGEEEKMRQLEEDLLMEEVAAFRAYVHLDIDLNKDNNHNYARRSSSMIPTSLEYYKQEAELLHDIAVASERVTNSAASNMNGDPDSVKWTLSVFLSNFSLAALDDLNPIVLISFTSKQKIVLKHNGSWVLDPCIIANMEIIDLTGSNESKLLCRKKSFRGTHFSETLLLGESDLYHSMSIKIKHNKFETCVEARLSPLEVVYSTIPFYSIHNLFSSVEIPEFSSDIQRMKAALSRWKNRQSAKLMRALVDRRKIFAEIDVFAPTILIPESDEVIIVELGNLVFRNTSKDFDVEEDSWILELSNTQVLSSKSNSTATTNSTTSNDVHHIVESFNLEFLIRTNYAKKEISEVSVNAILPRLVFNITTSATRLLHHLQMKWIEKKKSSRINAKSRMGRFLNRNTQEDVAGGKRVGNRSQHFDSNAMGTTSTFNFVFSAPFIAVRIENDIEGRDKFKRTSTPLINLTMQKIGGKITHCNDTTFAVHLGSLHTIDLYQQVGPEFEVMLSSGKDKKQSKADLVKLVYVKDSNDKKESKLSILFNELYVEWNPETLAALQIALRLPKKTKANEKNTESNNGVDGYLLRHEQTDAKDYDGITNFDEDVDLKDSKVNLPFLLSFSLSKLSINFNKETRKRRLITAVMDQTDVKYSTKSQGGTKIEATVGNLSFNDVGTKGGSLYSQILGLNMMKEKKSLVQLHFESFPRTSRDESTSVRIDSVNGAITGCDSLLCLTFSPMRFVFLQQLWLEIFDYLFEGVLGFEVWGMDRDSQSDAKLQDAKDNNIVFNAFSVDMESPVILLPSTYRSPHHIKLDLNKLKVSNYFSGKPHHHPFDIPMQWYNNCSIEVSGLNVQNWQGKKLSWPETYLNVLVKWPKGDSAPLIIPKWSVTFSIGELTLSLQRDDYVLLANFIFFNIMEETRNFEEWIARKAMLSRDLVNYGYDKKDHPPTTYNILIEVHGITLHLLDYSNGVSDIKCKHLQYRIEKLSDQIFHQELICTSIELVNTNGQWSTFSKLLFPLKENLEDQKSVFIYRSASRPNGDQNKSIEVNDACIYLVYPAWSNIRKFFVKIPPPEVLSEEIVSCVIQIGDRWYPINDEKKLETVELSFNKPINNGSSPSATSQFLVKLTSPRIVLLSNCNTELSKGLTLKLGHFEYLATVKPSSPLSTHFFIHDLELFTNNARNPRKSETFDSSLIHPLNFVMNIVEHHEKKVTKLIFNTIRCRAAYSDMSLAMDVGLKLAHDIKHSDIEMSSKTKVNAVKQSEKHMQEYSNDPKEESKETRRTDIIATCDGCTVLVIDDSLSHFAGAQELVQLHAGGLQFRLKKETLHDGNDTSVTSVRLNRIKIIDCLQPIGSPFSAIASSTSGLESAERTSVKGSSFSDKPDVWDTFCVNSHPSWGFVLSSSMMKLLNEQDVLENDTNSNELDLVSITHIDVKDTAEEFCLNFRALVVQWNPATVIALRRFVEKLRRVGKMKTIKMPLDDKEQSNEERDQCVRKEEKVSSIIMKIGKTFKARCAVEQLKIFLNKTRQSRRLLEVTCTGMNVAFERNERNQLFVSCEVCDVSALDPSSITSHPTFLEVVRQKESSNKLFALSYRIFSDDDIPESRNDWILSKTEKVDDFLFVRMSAVRFILLNDRTAELIDYLSNGLPAMGIGATKRAAKGFLECRIKTRSAMHIIVQTPTIFIPRHSKTNLGITIDLGDIDVKSWFEEGGENELADKMMTELAFDKEYESSVPDVNVKKACSVHQDWWRCLSIAISGIGRNLFFEEKVDFNLVLRRPSWYSQTTVVRVRVTRVNTVISYENWALFRAVINDNLLKPIDESGWDTVEKEAAMEDYESETSGVGVILNKNAFSEKVVKYVDGAQLIRFGKKQQINESNDHSSTHVSKPLLEVEFELSGLCLTLHRNDPLPVGIINTFCGYDFARLRVHCLKMGFSSFPSGDKSVYAKLYRMDLCDLGDAGRNIREDLCNKETIGETELIRKKCAFTVLAEGYGNGYGADIGKEEKSVSPQLVLTFDVSPENTPVARVVVDFLSINALVHPIVEIYDFLFLKWDSKNLRDSCQHSITSPTAISTTTVAKSRCNFFWRIPDEDGEKSNDSGFQLKFVAHYPRMFFLADESDPFSRALVLRGLAVINLSIAKEIASEVHSFQNLTYDVNDQELIQWQDIRKIITLDAHLNSMETFINPDVSIAFGFGGCGCEPNIKKNFSSTFDSSEKESDGSKQSGDELQLGIALIEPVTTTIEYCEVQRDLHPTNRNVVVSVKPVSTMISFEDLALIEAVVERMSMEGHRVTKDEWDQENSNGLHSCEGAGQNPKSLHTSINDEEQNNFVSGDGHSNIAEVSRFGNAYDVIFSTEKLGLVLRKAGDKFRVQHVLLDDYKNSINIGDILFSLDDEPISRLPLQTLTRLLNTHPRPLKLSFFRSNYDQNHSFESNKFASSKDNVFDYSKHLSNQSSLNSEIEQNMSGDETLTHSNHLMKVCFRVGMSNGLSFERSLCGDMALVTDLNPNAYSSSTDFAHTKGDNVERDSSSDKKIKFVPVPRPGAVVLKINDEITYKSGFRKTVEKLDFLSQKDFIANSAFKPNLNDVCLDASQESFYSITFLEAPSKAWSFVDKVQISVSGFKLTIIDDINGRDMPLVRGTLDEVDFHIRRGLGLRATLFHASPPSIFEKSTKDLSIQKMSEEDENFVLAHQQRDISEENVSRYKCEANACVKYYNARIATWEPFIEPCWLHVQAERQRGDFTIVKRHPGNFALFITDKFAKGNGLHGFEPYQDRKQTAAQHGIAESSDSFVRINLTDAVIEMLLKTGNEWTEWRKSKAENDIVESSNALAHLAETRIKSPKNNRVSNMFFKDDEAISTSDSRNLHSPRSSNKQKLTEIDSPSDPKHRIGRKDVASGSVLLNMPTFHERVASPDRKISNIKEPQSANLISPGVEVMTDSDAARKAAQVALKFARKRGAASQNTNGMIRPFTLRNRTGIKIAFVQQVKRVHDSSNFEKNELSRNSRYKHLFSEYDSSNIVEVNDGKDALFNIDLLDDSKFEFDQLFDNPSTQTQQHATFGKRIRTYDGQFPFISIAFDPALGSFDTLKDLPVITVGNYIRKVDINIPEMDLLWGRRSFGVVWSVVLNNNRRVLTLSSTVRICSIGCGLSLDVGYREEGSIFQHHDSIEHVHSKTNDDSEKFNTNLDEKDGTQIRRIGNATPESSFFLPLWLCLKNKVVIYLKPMATTTKANNTLLRRLGLDVTHNHRPCVFEWSNHGIIEYSNLAIYNEEERKGSIDTTWKWRHNILSEVNGRNSMMWKVMCSPREDKLSDHLLPVHLTVMYGSVNVNENKSHSQYNSSNESGILNISVGSVLSLRNLLPSRVEWEVATLVHNDDPPNNVEYLDGTAMRKDQFEKYGFAPLNLVECIPDMKIHENFESKESPTSSLLKGALLDQGDGTEIFTCDYVRNNTHVRFRCHASDSWTEWVALYYPNNKINKFANIDSQGQVEYNSFQIQGHQDTVQSFNKNGTALTFGVMFQPKLHGNMIYGIDLLLYSDLWIKNLTNLNLAFGAPEVHMCKSTKDFAKGSSIAEAALREIASVFEFGDMGKQLQSKKENKSVNDSDTCMLPHQNQCNEIYEEVFEYIEVDSSIVKKIWWASEYYDNLRSKPSKQLSYGDDWEWEKNSHWKIDCCGEASKDSGGWESSNDLNESKFGGFTPLRSFNSRHRYRRRRWFRKRVRVSEKSQNINLNFSVMFHHPILRNNRADLSFAEYFSQTFEEKNDSNEEETPLSSKPFSNDEPICIRVKCGDGRWSDPIAIPVTGSGYGIIRLYASRWQLLFEKNRAATYSSFSFDNSCLGKTEELYNKSTVIESNIATFKSESLVFSQGCLSPAAYDLSYHVSDISGPWGEVSRILLVNSRFLVRNDSKKFHFDVKQAGSPDECAIRVCIGEVKPFYWSDIRLPELLSIRPVSVTSRDMDQDFSSLMDAYEWSGGFDLGVLGMIALRVRLEIPNSRQIQLRNKNSFDGNSHVLRTVRAHIEIRPGTNGTGITLSVQEENSSGDGSLFRIENFSTFPIWVAQDGILLNYSSRSQKEDMNEPKAKKGFTASIDENDLNYFGSRNSDVVQPMSTTSFGLDVPYRQGKYAHRQAASMTELLNLRVSLAPMGCREGIENLQVINFTAVGSKMLLNPSQLHNSLDSKVSAALNNIRILGTVCTDGPTRVVRFCLVEKNPASNILGDVVRKHAKQSEAYVGKMAERAKMLSYFSPVENFYNEEEQVASTQKSMIVNGARKALELRENGDLLLEDGARMSALRGSGIFENNIITEDGKNDSECNVCDEVFTFRALFRGFLISFVDAVPSEISVASLQSVDLTTKWNVLRTHDAIATLTIGKVQVDNHCPNSPYSVALWQIEDQNQEDSKVVTEKSFLTVSIVLGRKHTSGILCVRSITVALRDTSISLDLAFIMRIRNFFDKIKSHTNQSKGGYTEDAAFKFADHNRTWPFPDLKKLFKDREEQNDSSAGLKDFYFERITILPFNLSVSVAQARALSNAQATLEGNEAAAVHAAVRKGDLLLGDGAGIVGVRINAKHKSPLAVIRGVLKSILVDALVRCDAAYLNFPGVAIRNHVASVSQLSTYISAHYLTALRSNVPALIGSLAAFGNPAGLIRGLGDGFSDFVSEPIKGLKKSMEELDPSLFVDGVARGTESLARHTVGGFADSASLLTETLSKHMTVLTLDPKYAQKRDLDQVEREADSGNKNFVDGVGSGGVKLLMGVFDGVTGVISAPIRGAEKKGVEGFAKGVGKGLLGLVVKPVIGLTDAATDVMVGVKGSVEGSQNNLQRISQVRPRRALYGHERALRDFRLSDATVAMIMTKTRLAGEFYMDHLFVGRKIALFGIKNMIVLGEDGRERICVKYKHVKDVAIRDVPKPDGNVEWGLLIYLLKVRRVGDEIVVINCSDRATALELCVKFKKCLNLVRLEKYKYEMS